MWPGLFNGLAEVGWQGIVGSTGIDRIAADDTALILSIVAFPKTLIR